MAGNLRVGIIGCGNMARHHVDGYLASRALRRRGPGRPRRERDARDGRALRDPDEAPPGRAGHAGRGAPGRGVDLHMAHGPRALDRDRRGPQAQGHPVREAHGRDAGPRRRDADRLPSERREAGHRASAPLPARLHAGPRPHRPGGDRSRVAHPELRRPGTAQLLLTPDRHVPLPARRRGLPLGDGQRRAEDRPVRADDPDRGRRGGGVRVRARGAGA